MKLWLQPLGPSAGNVLCLDRFPFVVGRKAECPGCLPFAFISRQHCRFTLDNGRVVVQDLESYNGTFVNGRSAAKPLPVQAGDELTLGPISFRVEMPCADLETAEAVLTQHEIELEASGQHESAPRR